MFHLQKYTCCIAMDILLERSSDVTHTHGSSCITVTPGFNNIKAGLTRKMLGLQQCKNSLFMQHALLEVIYNARKSLTAVHQPTGSTHFWTGPFVIPSKEISLSPQIRNSEN
jgi:hypothetical protein